MRKALLIGSMGNMGVPLACHLRNHGWRVLECDHHPAWREDYLMADINQPLDLLPAFDWRPDVVFLLAAMVSRVTCEQAGGLAIETNLKGLFNVLELCKRVEAKCVFFSTSEVYGPDCDPMDEAISDPKPNNRYGLSKLLGEKLVEYEARHHGLKAVILRPFMMYDENEDFGDHRSAMIRFTWRLAQGRPIEVHEGSARGWLHAEDAVRAITASADCDECAVINIGHPHIVPIAELAEMICARLAAPRELITVRALPERMTLVKRPTLVRQKEMLGLAPVISLSDGVDRVCRMARQRLGMAAVNR